MHMKTIRGIKIGGLQSKIFSLILFLIVGLIGTYTVVFGIHIKHLSAIVQRTGALGPMDSIYLRDPDGNLVEISVYRY